MKRRIKYAGILSALWLALNGAAMAGSKNAGVDADDLRKRIAVVDFIDKTDYGKGRLGIAASDILEGELQRSGKFTIVSHSGMDEILNLQALGQSGALDASTAVQAGRLVGANAIINGSVSEFGIRKGGFSVPGVVGTKSLLARAVVDIHLIDGTSGVILLSETAEGSANTRAAKVLNIGGEGTYDETLAGKALREALVTLVDKITSKMDTVPWEGFVLSSEGGEAWITGGEDVGIKKGMELEIKTAARQITAPNGKTYSLPGEASGRLRISEVMPDISRAEVIQGSAAKDNIVQLVKGRK
jgi:curli biogenesis system outer membrane secretion channel CsgG